ncbi:MAG: hypothetical protein HQK83_10350 [Fibrobacteria bacterium]|nr:hypothetical protein [Fibrobacteria bacterium]
MNRRSRGHGTSVELGIALQPNQYLPAGSTRFTISLKMSTRENKYHFIPAPVNKKFPKDEKSKGILTGILNGPFLYVKTVVKRGLKISSLNRKLF